MPGRFTLDTLRKPHRYLFECAILQESRKQHIARLENRDIVGVGVFPGGQKTHDLHVEQRCGDNQEFRGGIEFRRSVKVTKERDEFARHRSETHLGDVHLVFRNERNEKVEGSVEIREADAESVLGTRRSFQGKSALGQVRGTTRPLGGPVRRW